MRFLLTALVTFTLLTALPLDGAEPVKPATGEKPAPKAADLPGDQIGCAFASKETDFNAHKLSYKLSFGNKLQKPIIAFTGFFVLRDQNGKVLLHLWHDVTYENAPLAPGAVALFTLDDHAQKKADAAELAEWKKMAAGLTSVDLTVLKVTYADHTTQAFKTTVGVAKDRE